MNQFPAFKAPLAKALMLTLAVSGLTLLGGCTEQAAQVTDADPALLTTANVDVRRAQEDFAFPSSPPSLQRGKEVFQQHCAQCHATSYWQTQQVKEDIAYSTPIDMYLLLSTGKAPDVTMPTEQRRDVLPATHPGYAPNKEGFREVINRDDRWAVVFYTRYLAGGLDMQAPNAKAPDVANIFGGNCAVCHGTRGRADGPLYIGKTGNHELHNAEIINNFMPAPADFRMYSRMYNRTDAQLFKYICQGIYPSAMPSWYGNVERDKDTGEVIFVFDDALIWDLVRHVRSLSYNNDLPETDPIPPGIKRLQQCELVPQNQPWTRQMREFAPSKGQEVKFTTVDAVTGGMVLPEDSRELPVIRKDVFNERGRTGL